MRQERDRRLWLSSSRGDDGLDVDNGGGDDAQRPVSRYILRGYGEGGRRVSEGYVEVLTSAT